MIEINLAIDREDIIQLDALATNFDKGLLKGMRNAMFYAEGEAKKSFGKADHLKVLTGRLRRSIYSGAEKTADGVTGWVGANVVYAAIHELGGVIRARASKYLYFEVDGNFKKVQQVTIPARPYLRPAIEDNIDEIGKIIVSSIKREVGDK